MDLQIQGLGNEQLAPGYRQVLVPWAVQGGLNPPVITSAKGAYFQDQHGQSYLDLTSGYVAVSLGHGHPKVVKAIQAQAERLCWTASSYFNDVRAEYAELLQTISPWPEGLRVHFACGGGEANDDAIKIGAEFYLDTQITFTPTKNYEFFVGADNVLDNKAPKILMGTPFNVTGADTAADVYDIFGRRFYAGARLRF